MSWIMDNAERGQEYYGFICANPRCETQLLMGKIDPKDRDSAGGVQIQSHQANHTLTCPQCGHTAVYQIQQLQRFLVATKH
jgi:predicted RNA-binding Zn-ribbon protein involved in translation (DUF1610 family)